MSAPWKPSREDLEAARGSTVPDLVAPDLDVLFCGINPGLYSGAVEHHFARPGNRLWPALHRSGFTAALLSPFDEQELLSFGIGITNFVERTTASAAELSDDEIRAGVERLIEKVHRYQPRWLVPLGVTAYRVGFGHKKAVVGPQPYSLGSTRVWLLPNPSGLNAHYQLPQLVEEFDRLRSALEGRRK